MKNTLKKMLKTSFSNSLKQKIILYYTDNFTEEDFIDAMNSLMQIGEYMPSATYGKCHVCNVVRCSKDSQYEYHGKPLCIKCYQSLLAKGYDALMANRGYESTMQQEIH